MSYIKKLFLKTKKMISHLIFVLSFMVPSAWAQLTNQKKSICKFSESIPCLQGMGWSNCSTIHGKNECTFRGIVCDTLSNVIKLEINNVACIGTIPTEIGLIKTLKFFTIYASSLGGTLPTEFGSIKNISAISIYGGLISGTIPVEIFNTSLSILNIFRIPIIGSIPTEIGKSNISDFQIIDVSLTGTLPETINNLKLTQFVMGNCVISGTIPYIIFNSNISRVIIYNTSISGTIPDISNDLIVLWLSHNLLSGTIPNSLLEQKHIAHLDLSSNELSGTIPTLTTTRLNFFKLNGNSLSGTIPLYIFNQSSLLILDLSNNKLTGTVPTEISLIKSVMQINLEGNKFTGILPTQISTLTLLTILHLNNNELTGTIPYEYSIGLPKISSLDLSNNLLTGTLPAELFIHTFDNINLSINKLSGTIINNIFLKSTMGSIDISGNDWHGCAPIDPLLKTDNSKCILGDGFYSGCNTTARKCNITYNNNCQPKSGYYGSYCIPCNCQSGYYCEDGVSGTGDCKLFNPCQNHNCESVCNIVGLNYTCACIFPAILNTTDLKSCICPTGFYKKSNGSCYPCSSIDNCFSDIECNNANDSKCWQCNKGYYLQNSNQCLPCETIKNCFSIITCSNKYDSTCTLCDNGYSLVNNSCVVNKNCIFSDWSEWTPCEYCSGGSITRTRNISDINMALPIYCQSFLFNISLCGFPCADYTIDSRDAILEYLYNSFVEYNWLENNIQLNYPLMKLVIEKSNTSIIIEINSTISKRNEISNYISDFILNASLFILPNIDRERYMVEINEDSAIVLTVTENNKSSIAGIISGIIGGVFVFILIISVLLYFKFSNDLWLKSLPSGLRGYFDSYKHELGWEKLGNVYVKKISADTKDWFRFNEIWKKMKTDGIIITEVYALCNPILGANFANYREILQQRMNDSPALFRRQDWILRAGDSRLRSYTNERFYELISQYTWNKNPDKLPIVPCLHATNFDIAQSIASKGFTTLAQLDAGFYGKGMYFTTYANYAVPYFINKPDPALLVTLGTFGNVYPVIEHPLSKDNFVGQPTVSGYQSHFVLTNNTGYPITKQFDMDNEFNELVVAQEAQVVSIYIVRVSPDPNDKIMMKTLMKDRKLMTKSIDVSASQTDKLLDDTSLEMF